MLCNWLSSKKFRLFNTNYNTSLQIKHFNVIQLSVLTMIQSSVLGGGGQQRGGIGGEVVNRGAVLGGDGQQRGGIGGRWSTEGRY